MRRHPHLYEVNARLFVRRISDKYHQALTLGTVPSEEWQRLARQGFDLVWLMGVWQRSPGSGRQALHPNFRQEYDHCLPGWTDKDVAGSPYAIYAYRLDPALGEENELAQLKSRLNQLGLGLVLDFVPNHLAFDHPWTFFHHEWFVQGKEADVHAHPDWFFSPEKGIYLAHGKDPYFPPWTDTVQVNFFSPDLRQALIGELRRIAEVADGVRCDMAMLALNDIFEQVWGWTTGGYPRLKTEFWAEAIGRLKEQRPDFLFLAEVYWGLESKLQQLGFDFTYDKSLYDRLRFSTPDDIRSYLRADTLCQGGFARFIENHDELRAITAFGRERSLAAAVILATLPGLRLFHDGQLEGRRLRLPVQLVCEPKEVTDSGVAQFYDRLLSLTNETIFHEGEWGLLEAGEAWAGNESHRNLLAWSWRYREHSKVVVVNYSANPAQGRLKLPLPPKTTDKIVFRDELTGAIYPRDTSELSSQGLYIELASFQAHLFDVVPG